MKPRKILRPKEAWARLARGKTAFEENYRFHTPNDPFIPGTQIERLKPIRLGPRNVGFLEHEIDALIDALAKAGGHTESKAKNVKAARDAKVGACASRIFLTDALPPSRELLERRNKLRAQLSGDPDPETKSEIEKAEQALRALDQTK